MSQQLESREIRKFTRYSQNFTRYAAKRRAYKKQFPNQYVAVKNGNVILHSKDLEDLLKKLKQVEELDQIIVDHLSKKEKLIL